MAKLTYMDQFSALGTIKKYSVTGYEPHRNRNVLAEKWVSYIKCVLMRNTAKGLIAWSASRV